MKSKEISGFVCCHVQWFFPISPSMTTTIHGVLTGRPKGEITLQSHVSTNLEYFENKNFSPGSITRTAVLHLTQAFQEKKNKIEQKLYFCHQQFCYDYQINSVSARFLLTGLFSGTNCLLSWERDCSCPGIPGKCLLSVQFRHFQKFL